MKLKTLLYLSAAASLCLLVSCQKESSVATPGEPKEIVLSLAGDDLGLEVSTKAGVTVISDVPSSLYLSRTTGALKSETTQNGSASASVSARKIATGWYQTATATSYNYYLSNNAITFAAGGSTVVAENTVDVICGVASSSTTNPTVNLEHVFARTGSITLTNPSGYEISDVSFKISSQGAATGTKGTYNIAAKTWSSTTALAATTLTSSSDLYLIPGTYTIACTYTLKKGDYTQTFTKNATVTLVAGKKCNISGTAPTGNAQAITLSVTLTPWETQDVSMAF